MEYHGLAPIAVDLNINDLSMRMDLLKQAITKVRHTQSIAHSQHCWLRLVHCASLSCHCSHGFWGIARLHRTPKSSSFHTSLARAVTLLMSLNWLMSMASSWSR